MKRLVTQFDDRRMRATVATPTCCCCCCCCVGAILTATAVTAVNVEDLASQSELSDARRWLSKILAFLALPLAVGAAIAAGYALASADGDLAAVGVVGTFMVAWALLLIILYRQLALPRSGKVVAITVIVCTVLAAIEVPLGAFIILGLGSALAEAGALAYGGLAVYLGLAIAFPFVAVPLLRRWMASGGP